MADTTDNQELERIQNELKSIKDNLQKKISIISAQSPFGSPKRRSQRASLSPKYATSEMTFNYNANANTNKENGQFENKSPTSNNSNNTDIPSPHIARQPRSIKIETKYGSMMKMLNQMINHLEKVSPASIQLFNLYM